MTLTNLVKVAGATPDSTTHPFNATFLRHGQSVTYAIKDRAHLVRRFAELDRTAACPDAAEIDVMIANFVGVFDAS